MIPQLGKAPGEEKGNPLQYSGLENSMDCIVPGVTKSLTQVSDFHFHSTTLAFVHPFSSVWHGLCKTIKHLIPHLHGLKK